jgi:hypothetical protein
VLPIGLDQRSDQILRPRFSFRHPLSGHTPTVDERMRPGRWFRGTLVGDAATSPTQRWGR